MHFKGHCINLCSRMGHALADRHNGFLKLCLQRPHVTEAICCQGATAGKCYCLQVLLMGFSETSCWPRWGGVGQTGDPAGLILRVPWIKKLWGAPDKENSVKSSSYSSIWLHLLPHSWVDTALVQSNGTKNNISYIPPSWKPGCHGSPRSNAILLV